ncbi:GAF domain-containing protein, partial [candidate division KSB1 bacterium]
SYKQLVKFVEDFKIIENKYKQLIEALQNRTELLELLTVISTTFISLNSEDTDEEISCVLELVGKYSDFDRCYVFLFSKDGKIMNKTHEWCSEEIEPRIQNLKELSVDTFPWLMERIKSLDIIYILSVANLPSSASTEKRFFKSQKAHSAIIIPMFDGNSIVGFLGFDSVSSKVIWSKENVELLQVLSKILVSALKCKHREEALSQNHEEFKKKENYFEEEEKDLIAELIKDDKQIHFEF